MQEKDLRTKEVFGQRVTLCEVIDENQRRYEIRLHHAATYAII